MAQSFSLSTYVISNKRSNPHNRIVLSDYYQGKDLLDDIYSMLDKWKYDEKNINISLDSEEKKVFRISKDQNGCDLLNKNGRFISGIIQSGDYGTEEPLVKQRLKNKYGEWEPRLDETLKGRHDRYIIIDDKIEIVFSSGFDHLSVDSSDFMYVVRVTGKSRF